MSSSITTSGVSRDSGVDVNLRGDAPGGEPTENRDESWVTTNLTGSPETGSAVRPEPKAGAGVAPWHGAESDLVRPRNRDVASKAHMRPPSFVLQRPMVEFIARDGLLAIRKIEDGDAQHLSSWLSDPQVLQFYGGRDQPRDLKRVREEFYKDDGINRCIVEWEGVPVGYIQFYQNRPEENAEYGFASTESIWAMDQFIGATAYWNSGIGSQLVRDMAEYLLSHGASHVVTDPEAWNTRAIRAYEKAGFVKVRFLPKHECHEGVMHDSWLMEYKPARDSAERSSIN